MKIARVLLTVVPLLGVCACSGGGSTPAPLAAAWEKFRHDANNSGQGNGSILTNNGLPKWHTSIDGSPISSSPAIDINGTLYIGTEGGTLAALEPTQGGIKWTVTSCEVPANAPPGSCPAGKTQPLGKLVSSPAIYAFNSLTYIFIGSASGSVYVIQDNGTTRTCAACFEPQSSDFGTGATIAGRFLSSPAFTTSPLTLAVSGIFIGAAVDVTQAGATRTVGKLYALNTDGSLIWEFPRVGEEEIGAVTSSPAIGLANALFFSADDGNLYALSQDGTFKWSFPIGAVADPRAPFSASPLINNLVFAPSASGEISALGPDGSFRWQVSSPDGTGFLSSLAAGAPATTTPTITPTIPATPTPPPGATRTPTATVTPVRPVTAIFGVTVAGTLVQIDAATGEMNMLLGPAPPTPIVGPVVSSPFLSFEGYLVVGAADGKLHAVNTITGAELTGWPVTLGKGSPIRSSPSVDNNGIVYVGSDDGNLYAVGTQ